MKFIAIAKLESLKRWKRCAALFLLGSILALALPPFYIFPALLTFTLCLLILDGSVSKKQAFFTGWWFGFGFFTAGLYWIANALLIDPIKFGWLVPFAALAFPALLATSTGFAALFTYMIPRPGWRKVLIFSCFWIIAEVVRGYFYVAGFPWNLIGYSLDFSDYLIQIASVTGVWGLSLIAVVLGAMPYVFFRVGRRIIPIVATLAAIAAILIFGWVRLENAIVWGKTIQVNLIQANIQQKFKWDPNERQNNFLAHLELTSYTNKYLSNNLIIWPESAVPFLLEEQPELRRAIADVMPEGSYLVTGGLRMEGDEKNYKFWNSLFLLDDEGSIIGVYDKSHLVPFGEYVPFRKFLPFVDSVAGSGGDFSRGEGPKTITLPNGMKIGALICYEIIFPHQVVEMANRPDVLINVTNDSWYGISTGPYQHFESARLRAVEEGIPVIRAANSGISGAIDRYGRVIAKLGLNKKGNLQSEIVLANNTDGRIDTIFSRFNLIIILLAVSILGFFAIFSCKKP